VFIQIHKCFSLFQYILLTFLKYKHYSGMIFCFSFTFAPCSTLVIWEIILFLVFLLTYAHIHRKYTFLWARNEGKHFAD